MAVGLSGPGQHIQRRSRTDTQGDVAGTQPPADTSPSPASCGSLLPVEQGAAEGGGEAARSRALGGSAGGLGVPIAGNNRQALAEMSSEVKEDLAEGCKWLNRPMRSRRLEWGKVLGVKGLFVPAGRRGTPRSWALGTRPDREAGQACLQGRVLWWLCPLVPLTAGRIHSGGAL